MAYAQMWLFGSLNFQTYFSQNELHLHGLCVLKLQSVILHKTIAACMNILIISRDYDGK